MLLSELEEFIVFGFVPLMIGILAAPVRPRKGEQPVAGRIVIPSSHALPPHAVAIIEIVEHRLGHGTPRILARETIDWRGSDAQKFTVRIDPSTIEPMAYYAVRASIVANGTVWFETRYPQPVAPLSGDPTTLTLVSVAPRA